MKDPTTDEVLEVFKKSRSVEQAAKSFLRREVQKGSPEEQFVRNFKSALTSGSEARARSFIDKYLANNQNYFLALAGYAHLEFITGLSNKVFDKYADEFNATYETLEKEVRVKDKKKFAEIVKSTTEMLDAELKAYALPDSWFMKKTALNAIFEPRVMQQVLPLLA